MWWARYVSVINSVLIPRSFLQPCRKQGPIVEIIERYFGHIFIFKKFASCLHLSVTGLNYLWISKLFGQAGPFNRIAVQSFVQLIFYTIILLFESTFFPHLYICFTSTIVILNIQLKNLSKKDLVNLIFFQILVWMMIILSYRKWVSKLTSFHFSFPILYMRSSICSGAHLVKQFYLFRYTMSGAVLSVPMQIWWSSSIRSVPHSVEQFYLFRRKMGGAVLFVPVHNSWCNYIISGAHSIAHFY